MLLAVLADNEFPKNDLAGMYLAVGYFGGRMNGVLQACDRLGRNLADLTDREAASIVARLKYPEPLADCAARREQIERRAEYILNGLRTTVPMGKAGELDIERA